MIKRFSGFRPCAFCGFIEAVACIPMGPGAHRYMCYEHYGGCGAHGAIYKERPAQCDAQSLADWNRGAWIRPGRAGESPREARVRISHNQLRAGSSEPLPYLLALGDDVNAEEIAKVERLVRARISFRQRALGPVPPSWPKNSVYLGIIASFRRRAAKAARASPGQTRTQR